MNKQPVKNISFSKLERIENNEIKLNRNHIKSKSKFNNFRIPSFQRKVNKYNGNPEDTFADFSDLSLSDPEMTPRNFEMTPRSPRSLPTRMSVNLNNNRRFKQKETCNSDTTSSERRSAYKISEVILLKLEKIENRLNTVERYISNPDNETNKNPIKKYYKKYELKDIINPSIEFGISESLMNLKFKPIPVDFTYHKFYYPYETWIRTLYPDNVPLGNVIINNIKFNTKLSKNEFLYFVISQIENMLDILPQNKTITSDNCDNIINGIINGKITIDNEPWFQIANKLSASHYNIADQILRRDYPKIFNSELIRNDFVHIRNSKITDNYSNSHLKYPLFETYEDCCPNYTINKIKDGIISITQERCYTVNEPLTDNHKVSQNVYLILKVEFTTYVLYNKNNYDFKWSGKIKYSYIDIKTDKYVMLEEFFDILSESKINIKTFKIGNNDIYTLINNLDTELSLQHIKPKSKKFKGKRKSLDQNLKKFTGRFLTKWIKKHTKITGDNATDFCCFLLGYRFIRSLSEISSFQNTERDYYTLDNTILQKQSLLYVKKLKLKNTTKKNKTDYKLILHF